MPHRLAGLLLAALLACGCDVKVGEGGLSLDISQGKATDEWTRTYDIAPGGRFEILNVNGTIEAAAAAGSKVEVRAVREAKASSDEVAKALLDKFQMVEEVAADSVRIEAKGDWNRGMGGMGRRSQFSIRYIVKLPAGLHAVLKTENGGIRLDSIKGTVAASTTNGGINGAELSGPVTAATVNGGVQIALASVSGNIEVVAVNGGIRLEVPSDADAELDVSAVNGGVSVDGDLGVVVAEQDRRHVAGKLNRGGPKITAQTTNGGVKVSAGRPRRPTS